MAFKRSGVRLPLAPPPQEQSNTEGSPLASAAPPAKRTGFAPVLFAICVSVVFVYVICLNKSFTFGIILTVDYSDMTVNRIKVFVIRDMDIFKINLLPA